MNDLFSLIKLVQLLTFVPVLEILVSLPYFSLSELLVFPFLVFIFSFLISFPCLHFLVLLVCFSSMSSSFGISRFSSLSSKMSPPYLFLHYFVYQLCLNNFLVFSFVVLNFEQNFLLRFSRQLWQISTHALHESPLPHRNNLYLFVSCILIRERERA